MNDLVKYIDKGIVEYEAPLLKKETIINWSTELSNNGFVKPNKFKKL